MIRGKNWIPYANDYQPGCTCTPGDEFGVRKCLGEEHAWEAKKKMHRGRIGEETSWVQYLMATHSAQASHSKYFCIWVKWKEWNISYYGNMSAFIHPKTIQVGEEFQNFWSSEEEILENFGNQSPAQSGIHSGVPNWFEYTIARRVLDLVTNR